jgi:hypothetical protein
MRSNVNFKATKAGAGDKERAYIVKQNFVLRVIIIVGTIATIITGVLLTTRYEMTINRRNSIYANVQHRTEEHRANMKLVQMEMALQVPRAYLRIL